MPDISVNNINQYNTKSISGASETSNDNDVSVGAKSSSGSAGDTESAENSLVELDIQTNRNERKLRQKKFELEQKEKQLQRIKSCLNGSGGIADSNLQSKANQLSSEIELLQQEVSGLEAIIKQEQTLRNMYVNKINQSMEANASNSVSSTYSSNIVAKNFDGYNSAKGNKLVEAAKSLYGNVHTVNGMCAKGVSEAMQKAFGVYPGKNGNDYCDWLASSPNWKEVDVAYEDLKNLPAGAIVTWKSYGSGASVQYGHVYISDGQGGQLCDRYDVPNGKDYNAYRLNTSHGNYSNGKPYRVFIPV